MFWKIALTCFLLLMAWGVFFRKPRGLKRITKRRRNPLADQTLVKCPSCGIYIAAGDTCTCNSRG